MNTLLKEKIENNVVEINGPLHSKCWVWTRGCFTDGYGSIRHDGRYQKAHRISWLAYNGDIPNDLMVLHHCDNPPCCNPEHLFLGTAQDNVEDMRSKGRDSYGQNKGECNGQNKLKQDQVAEIKWLLRNTGLTQTRIGELYAVDRGTVRDIKLGYTWSWLKQETKPKSGDNIW